MTRTERNDLWGGLFGLAMFAIPIVAFIFTGVSNEMCKANEEYCSDYLHCYYYEKGCEEYPDLVTYREKQMSKASQHDSVWQAKFKNNVKAR